MAAELSRMVCATLSHFDCSSAVIFRSACSLVMRASTVSPLVSVAALASALFCAIWAGVLVADSARAPASGLTNMVVPRSAAIATVRRRGDELAIVRLSDDMGDTLCWTCAEGRRYRAKHAAAQPSESTHDARSPRA